MEAYAANMRPLDKSNTHFHGNTRMRIITLNGNILTREIINILHLSPPQKLWEWSGLPFQLQLQCIDVISIDVRVSELDDEFMWLGIGDVRNHVGKKSVRGDIKWYTETKVGRALDHKAGEFWLVGRRLRQVDIELAHHVARRKSHKRHVYKLRV